MENMSLISGENTTQTTPEVGELGFVHGFIASLAVILVSEIGDKTFFIAAIMSMTHSRLLVFAGAISALALMTVISVVFGYTANLIPKVYISVISTVLFTLFGLKMLWEGYKMSPNQGLEELEEIQSNQQKLDEELGKEISTATTPSTENDTLKPSNRRFYILLLKIMFQAFTLTFVAELGDRSQISTIILAAREDVFGVVLGAVVGHSLCTGVAVIGGRFVAQKISVRTVTIIGGLVFLLFSFSVIYFEFAKS